MALHNRINKDELKHRISEDPTRRVTLSFYKYHAIEDPKQFRDELYRRLESLGVLGRIYVAAEGINAQISVPEERFADFKTCLSGYPFLAGVRLNVAIEDDGKSFYLLKIKLRDKIVADGLDDSSFDLSQGGLHLDAKTFNAMTEAESTIVVDMRNHYESEVGHFENAICPDVETFRDSLASVETILEPHRDKDIIMYCTGGIRCEKATAYFRSKGFEHLYQLDGGIIEYTRQVDSQGLRNKFRGKNFVFDDRLGERISPEVIAQCHQCGQPCDTHVNCANDACHLLFIQCASCAATYHHCCSKKCAEFAQLPEAVQREERRHLEFNGSKFGKGRYRARQKDQALDLG